MMIRDDLSDKLVHLTRGATNQAAAESFLAILHGKKIVGGTGDIRGSFKCVCFSESPVSKLGIILSQPSTHGMRYSPFGVMVSKQWLFEKGGRPVIYQSEDEFSLLPEELQYRHVRYEPHNKIDHTWEREWRIRTDALELDSNETTVIVPNRPWETWFLKKHAAAAGRRAMVLHGLGGVRLPPWHIMVLEDLGVPVPSIDPPPELD